MLAQILQQELVSCNALSTSSFLVEHQVRFLDPFRIELDDAPRSRGLLQLTGRWLDDLGKEEAIFGIRAKIGYPRSLFSITIWPVRFVAENRPG